MNAFVTLMGLLLVGLGVLGIAAPRRLVALVSKLPSRAGLYAAAAIRLAFGGAMILAAPNSRAPEFLHVFGVIAVVAGVITPFLGVHRFEALVAWWSRRADSLLRVWGLAPALLGAAVVWAAAP